MNISTYLVILNDYYTSPVMVPTVLNTVTSLSPIIWGGLCQISNLKSTNQSAWLGLLMFYLCWWSWIRW